MKKLIFFCSVLFLSRQLFAATVSGSVQFSGTAPKMETISMSADPVCAGLHSEPVYAETVVVNSNNTLKNVFVNVK
jgi:hypothetical protein